MKIRTVTYFVALESSDFDGQDTSLCTASSKLSDAVKALDLAEEKLCELGYELQTKRVTFNSFEHWLNVEGEGLDVKDVDQTSGNGLVLQRLDALLQEHGINFCSLGEARSDAGIRMTPALLHFSKLFNTSVCIDSGTTGNSTVWERRVCPNQQTCLLAAEAAREIHRLEGDSGNFRFTVSFDCDGRTPFFPASFFCPESAAAEARKCKESARGGKTMDGGSADAEAYAFNYAARPPNGNGAVVVSPSSLSASRARDLRAFRGLAVGLESGDLLFLSCFGADSCEEARDNLYSTLVQTLGPINKCMLEVCSALNSHPGGGGEEVTQAADSEALQLEWLGVDASINPGLSPVDSVAAGLEAILFLDTGGVGPPHGRGEGGGGKDNHGETPDTAAREVASMMAPSKTRDAAGGFDVKFGQFGTLAAVSAVTGAVKALRASRAQRGAADSSPKTHAFGSLTEAYMPSSNTVEIDESAADLRLCGYCGLMLPVMEDVVLASRAAGTSLDSEGSSVDAAAGSFTLRDLLTFSSVCGVGLDTVPVPGDVTTSQLAAVYTETGALAYRLGKPLSCRVLPMRGLQAGEMTRIAPEDNPYLTNTRVFSL
jgi:uncharacterized protein (UPF0210 family)